MSYVSFNWDTINYELTWMNMCLILINMVLGNNSMMVEYSTMFLVIGPKNVLYELTSWSKKE